MLFAAARPAVGAVLRQMFTKPKTAGDWFGAAMRYGPDLGFAAYNAAMLPEDATWGDRALAAAEAYGINALSSGLGELGGGLIRRRIGERRGFAQGSEALRNMTEQGIQSGGMIGGLAGGFLPMPLTAGIYENLMRKQQEREEAMAQVEQGKTISDLAGFGALAAQPFIDPRYLM